MLAEITPEELSDGLDQVVMQVLTKAGIQRPPIDAFKIAQALGITLASDHRQAGRARYVRLAGGRAGRPKATILFRPDVRFERMQWAVAHEIGEHLAQRVFRTLQIDPREGGTAAREAVANSLAGRFLLPTPWFVEDGQECDWDLHRLKHRYQTASHELIARRMLDGCGPIVITIFDHGRVSFRRSNLPGRAPTPCPAEMQCWQAVHEHNRPEELAHQLLRIRGWPVHEEGWKREVLRTELDELAVSAYD